MLISFMIVGFHPEALGANTAEGSNRSGQALARVPVFSVDLSDDPHR
jgi:hypothetical protein